MYSTRGLKPWGSASKNVCNSRTLLLPHNAIGHARATYNSANNQIRFIDADKHGVITWGSNDVPFSEFAEMALELEDSSIAFLNIFILLKIYDFIGSTNPYA